ncbi:hypothetical protein IV203_037323 [Nitzschia inconspicua]|uniref:Uncharacterized protein n=1 Tax=Nitzschia inconspicua TaxID=303405 RepID=A0A9K3K820_9STRA|nr:hypothetical protein IV203_006357 [Nitzschia inconspicua]KAG7364121.1 hypothetical protein IV203_037323 [Nitzschia inconspicua]
MEAVFQNLSPQRVLKTPSKLQQRLADQRVDGGVWKSTNFHRSKRNERKNRLNGHFITSRSIQAGSDAASTSGEHGYDLNVVNSGDGGCMISMDTT